MDASGPERQESVDEAPAAAEPEKRHHHHHHRARGLEVLHKPLSKTEFAFVLAVVVVGLATIASVVRGTPALPHVKKVGCFTGDSAFSKDKWAPTESDSTVGANVALGLEHARISAKKYFAVARDGMGEGGAYTFDRLSGKPDASGADCDRPCDDFPDFACGCSNAGCKEKGETR
jgi:hypothetical protein